MTPRLPKGSKLLPRWLVVVLTVSVIINVLIAGAFVVLAVIQVHQSRQLRDSQAEQKRLSDRIHASQIQSCEAGNANRLKDIAVWNRLLNVNRRALSPSQRAEVDQLTALVRAKDTPVNCPALYRT